jgi:hypothetical protein
MPTRAKPCKCDKLGVRRRQEITHQLGEPEASGQPVLHGLARAVQREPDGDQV